MKHETFLNIVDFIADLGIMSDVLECSVKTHKLNVPENIKKYILTEIEYDKKIISHKREVRKKVIAYLKKEGCIINLPLN